MAVKTCGISSLECLTVGILSLWKACAVRGKHSFGAMNRIGCCGNHSCLDQNVENNCARSSHHFLKRFGVGVPFSSSCAVTIAIYARLASRNFLPEKKLLGIRTKRIGAVMMRAARRKLCRGSMRRLSSSRGEVTCRYAAGRTLRGCERLIIKVSQHCYALKKST